jgi:predicted Zn-dependent peptidase
VQFNRYGEDSYYLRALPNEKLQALTVDELLGLVRGLLDYKHTISYAGSLPLERVAEAIRAHHRFADTLADPPPYRYLRARTPGETEILFFNKQVAQSQVRLEFGDEDYDETSIPAIQLYNNYFSGGMGGIVFQELREARALAYVAAARYLTGTRKGDQNLMAAIIGCQPDKTSEAVEAFVDLIDNLPVSPDRFQEARQSMLNQYRTSKVGFREVLGAVRSWERLGVPVDPRKTRFEKIGAADMDLMLDFHGEHLKQRPKLISIVGDSSRIDMERLAGSGKIVHVGLGDIFVF